MAFRLVELAQVWASFDFSGNPFDAIFTYRTLGITGEKAINKLCIPLLNYIKLDVDKIEHFILAVMKKIMFF